MSEMTLPSRHRIRNSVGGCSQYLVLRVDGNETICFFQTAETGKQTLKFIVKGSGANHYPRAPALN